MKTPKAFGGSLGVLNKAMSIIVVLYVGMGVFGYLKYKQGALGSITLNLPDSEWSVQQSFRWQHRINAVLLFDSI